jgi:hypothetical protein
MQLRCRATCEFACASLVDAEGAEEEAPSRHLPQPPKHKKSNETEQKNMHEYRVSNSRTQSQKCQRGEWIQEVR